LLTYLPVYASRWDALNSFIQWFKIGKVDALELRRYYIERANLARAKSRRRVMNDFSPALAEKYVWKLNKEWLMRVPCFSLLVERLQAAPDAAMEGFLVKVALAMQPEVYVPSEQPPSRRLYIVTHGLALYRGKRISVGDSWGAPDVLLHSMRGRAGRAVALTYLHALWINAEQLSQIGEENRSGYLLTKLWATVYAAGTVIVEDFRKLHKEIAIVPVRIGTAPGEVSPSEVEFKINRNIIKVMPMTNENGELALDDNGNQLFEFKYPALSLGKYMVTQRNRESFKARRGRSSHQQFKVSLRPNNRTRRASAFMVATSSTAADSFSDSKSESGVPAPSPAYEAAAAQVLHAISTAASSESVQLLQAIRAGTPAATHMAAASDADGRRYADGVGFSFGGMLHSMGWGEGEGGPSRGTRGSAHDEGMAQQMATLTSEVQGMGKLLHALMKQQLRQPGPEANPRPTGLDA